jgi:hypothetical protein
MLTALNGHLHVLLTLINYAKKYLSHFGNLLRESESGSDSHRGISALSIAAGKGYGGIVQVLLEAEHWTENEVKDADMEAKGKHDHVVNLLERYQEGRNDTLATVKGD